MTKVSELTCTFHEGSECMGLGCLSLWQHPDETVAIGRSIYLGVFCTLSALQAWCDKQGTVTARKGDLRRGRPPKPKHPELRPEVPNRRPRQSLAPRRADG
jgi:hypothetical protein